MKKLSIIDYGMSNLLSLSRAFEHIGAQVNIISSPAELHKSDYVVLPGVGAFPDGMEHLTRSGFTESLLSFADREKPLMGICLGMQMLMTKGYEHRECAGLNLIEGEVLELPKDQIHAKVPNINWHSIELNAQWKHQKSILQNTADGTNFYFVHSYYVKPVLEENILAYSRFGELTFAAAVIKDNICGTQFHPEKSGKDGLQVLRSFLAL